MKIDVIKRKNIFVNREYLAFLDRYSLETFEDFMELEGAIAKNAVTERSTHRVNLGGQAIYIKKHAFAGIREVLENLLRFRLPPGALNEWRAILAFHAKEIPTMIPMIAVQRYSSANMNGASRSRCAQACADQVARTRSS